MARNEPHVTEAQTLARLQSLAAYDRNLFIAHLAEALGTLPTVARLKALAAKAPKAHAEYIATYTRLAGFTERTESLNMHLIADLSALSDVDLQAKLADVTQQLRILSTQNDSDAGGGRAVDITPHTDDIVSVRGNDSVHRSIAQHTDKPVRIRNNRKKSR